jgi:hypothetical protein
MRTVKLNRSIWLVTRGESGRTLALNQSELQWEVKTVSIKPKDIVEAYARKAGK